MLRNLHASVEVEEGVWKKKVEDAGAEASKAKREAERLEKAVQVTSILSLSLCLTESEYVSWCIVRCVTLSVKLPVCFDLAGPI